jgi:hypothetical protein
LKGELASSPKVANESPEGRSLPPPRGEMWCNNIDIKVLRGGPYLPQEGKCGVII